MEISIPKGSYIPVFKTKKTGDNILMLPSPAANKLSEKITIAILPFKTFETDVARASFTDGLGQQLSAELGKFSDFSIVSYYATQLLSSKNKNIQGVVSRYGAQYVVTGNVQFETRRLRVSVQLIDTLTGLQIWTESYDRNYAVSKLFGVADDIVTHIVGRLGDFNGQIIQQVARGVTLNKSGLPFSTVLSYYHNFYSSLSSADFRKAYDAMQHAVIHEPGNEMAWAFFGELSLVAFLFKQKTEETPVLLALRCAQTSLKINPLSQHGYITLAMANIFLKNKEAGQDALEHAIDLNPNASGFLGIIGCLMICIGEYNRGIILIEKSMDQNKSYPPFLNLFTSLYHFKQSEYLLADNEAQKISMPNSVLRTVLRICALFEMDRKQEANELRKTIDRHTTDQLMISKDYLNMFLLDKNLVAQLSHGFRSAKIYLLTVA